MTLHEKHMKLIDAVNNSETASERRDAYIKLQGWRDGVRDAGGYVDLIGADIEQFRRGFEHVPMCCGVFNDWKPKGEDQ